MREKKQYQYKQDVIDEVERLKLTFTDFSHGVRCIFLIHRNKEGGSTNNTKTSKAVTTNTTEFWEEVARLIEIKNNADVPYRIYSSVNSRDINKAIRQFKIEQLDADYYDEESRNRFYLDIKNRWIGCLMQPPQRDSSYFLFDVDTPDNSEALKQLSEQEIVLSYPTKNGWHIVTAPFNHTKISIPDTEFNKDGLLLLSY